MSSICSAAFICDLPLTRRLDWAWSCMHRHPFVPLWQCGHRIVWRVLRVWNACTQRIDQFMCWMGVRALELVCDNEFDSVANWTLFSPDFCFTLRIGRSWNRKFFFRIPNQCGANGRNWKWRVRNRLRIVWKIVKCGVGGDGGDNSFHSDWRTTINQSTEIQTNEKWTPVHYYIWCHTSRLQSLNHFSFLLLRNISIRIEWVKCERQICRWFISLTK